MFPSYIIWSMPGPDPQNPLIIGVTGSFGSGCSYIAENILKDKEGYTLLSLSKDVLRPLFQKQVGKDPDQSPRRELQDFGDRIREEKASDYLAQEAIKIIEENQNGRWVIDSIRNPAEVRCLRQYSRNFFLFGVYADREVRWNRVKGVYDDNRREFDNDDRNDTGEDNPSHGQRVGDCFYAADIVLMNDEPYAEIDNEDFNKFAGRIGEYINLVSRPLARQRPIRQEESLMAAAYAISQRSSCMRRKVGAVIVDPLGNVISSGFNEVPGNEKPCEKKYKRCYRDWVCSQFFEDLKTKLPGAEGKEAELNGLFRKRFKILDYCRALHAEENAIVNLARNGSSVPLEQCTLYSTTYPCRMCANRIVQVGIRHIVYLEPYPDAAAKLILQKDGVIDRFFEGVTSNAYFRLYGEEK